MNDRNDGVQHDDPATSAPPKRATTVSARTMEIVKGLPGPCWLARRGRAGAAPPGKGAARRAVAGPRRLVREDDPCPATRTAPHQVETLRRHPRRMAARGWNREHDCRDCWPWSAPRGRVLTCRQTIADAPCGSPPRSWENPPRTPWWPSARAPGDVLLPRGVVAREPGAAAVPSGGGGPCGVSWRWRAAPLPGGPGGRRVRVRGDARAPGRGAAG
ncbi:hypothetical protein QJS66_10390 [Kocuria rhizophila]|nr:hypothetical protein QJS66_10390 [Kocuria rhizophila]